MKAFLGMNPGDSIGNRRFNKEAHIPLDEIGNQLEREHSSKEAPDDLGNSIDAAPTHVLSSVTHRRKSDPPHVRMGRYIVGGVNPIVAGFNHANAEENTEKPNNQTQKRLKRLFNFEERKPSEYTLTSSPEEKRLLAEQTLKKIFEAGKLEAEISTGLEESEGQPMIAAWVKTPVFKTGELPFAALHFLVYKIVNKTPTDRIKLVIREPGLEAKPNSDSQN